MKNCIVLLVALAMSFPLFAQNCNDYFPMKEGLSYELTSYNKKDKKTGTTHYLIKNVEKAGDKFSGDITMTLRDKNDKELNVTEYTATCSNGTYLVDIQSMFGSGTEAMQGAQVDISGTALEMPAQLSVGQSLPDADMISKIDMGVLKMDITTKIFNRKVEARESITTPAGTFDCYKISYDTTVDSGFQIKATGVQWIAEKYGLVKQESYNSKGKLESYSVLSKYNE